MSLLLNTAEVALLAALSRYGVRYLVIGGHAVIFHGHLRPAKDLDLWVEPSESNAKAIAAALAEVRIQLDDQYVVRLAKPGLQMKIGGLYTELLTSISGFVDFANTFARSVGTYEQGAYCRVISLPDLVASKKALGRESDLSDVAHLTKLNTF
jgi:hypothetical protein